MLLRNLDEVDARSGRQMVSLSAVQSALYHYLAVFRHSVIVDGPNPVLKF